MNVRGLAPLNCELGGQSNYFGVLSVEGRTPEGSVSSPRLSLVFHGVGLYTNRGQLGSVTQRSAGVSDPAVSYSLLEASTTARFSATGFRLDRCSGVVKTNQGHCTPLTNWLK